MATTNDLAATWEGIKNSNALAAASESARVEVCFHNSQLCNVCVSTTIICKSMHWFNCSLHIQLVFKRCYSELKFHRSAHWSWNVFNLTLEVVERGLFDAKDLLNCLMVYIFANTLDIIEIQIQLNTKQQKDVLIIKFGTCSTCAKFWITINLLSPPQWPEYLNNVFSCQFVFKLRFFIAQLKALP